jgi:hypothetical protein
MINRTTVIPCNPTVYPPQAAHLPKPAPSLSQTNAFAKSAAPPHQYLTEWAKQPEKLGTVAPTALVVTRQILLDEKD